MKWLQANHRAKEDCLYRWYGGNPKIFRINTENLNILHVSTSEAEKLWDEFHVGHRYIDWHRIAQQYDGIEFQFGYYPRPGLKDLDVASGCIWSGKPEIILLGTYRDLKHCKFRVL